MIIVEGGREGGRERGREGEREGGREGGREGRKESHMMGVRSDPPVCMAPSWGWGWRGGVITRGGWVITPPQHPHPIMAMHTPLFKMKVDVSTHTSSLDKTQWIQNQNCW